MVQFRKNVFAMQISSNYSGEVFQVFILNCLRNEHEAVMVYKSVNGLAPNYLCFKFSERSSHYSLRDVEAKLTVPLPRTNFMKNSFSYSGAKLWKSLPVEFGQAKSVSSFSLRLQKNVP